VIAVDCLRAVSTIASIGLLVDSFEMLASRRSYTDSGMFSYLVVGRSRRLFVGGGSVALRSIFRYPALLVMPALQMCLGAYFLIAALDRLDTSFFIASGIAAVTVVVIRAAMYLRLQLGIDGGDQMLMTVFIGLSISYLSPDTLGRLLGLYYIAAQFLLSYLTSGTCKLISPQWRSGRALPGILSTAGYGKPTLGSLLRSHPLIARVLCWSVILIECFGPFLILAGTPGGILLVILALSLHMSIALVMGLNNFLWSFAACLPAVLFVSSNIEHVMH
jgi:hypothetical protein